MKKQLLCLSLLVLSLVMLPNSAMATETNPGPNTTEKTEIPVEVKTMLDRIEEIKDMDKSDLSRAERKELRTEVRTIKRELRSSGNGLYISTGAIIIILLLIIIL
ncbi:hypothetical protein V8G61_01385 [Gaetbulibacter sp. M240]|uniref:hypothetical protein n=1 Tax=Gaetbulibacter sp. M240 TaxID=3126511 RepID=UPI00374F007D